MEQNQLVGNFGQAANEFRAPGRHGSSLLRAASAPLRVLLRGAAIALGRIATAAVGLLAPGVVAAALTVTPITWDIVGLDSNVPASGPRYFPVGARVCSSVATTNVNASLVWDSANDYIRLRLGSLATINIPSLAAGACADAYFEAEVQQVAAAYDTARRYRITATDGSGSASTPTPRQLYVEHLVSQARNGVWDLRLDGVSVPAGGTMALLVGNTYNIELAGATATQGYNQLESFINFSNTIFQILAVNTTYSANTSPTVANPNDRLYADACAWDSNPLSANYRSCVGGDGKAGGTVVTNYTVKIIGGGGTSTTLNSLIYDFSGSSYHYNADYAISGRIAAIVDPSSLSIAKAFTPTPTVAGGTSVLSFTVANPNAGAVSGVSFTDNLPALPAQMTVASPATYATSGCGTPAFAPVAGATSLSFANGSVAAGGICTVSVRVSVPAAPTTGTYVNTSNNLLVGSVNTGKSATANLDLVPSVPGTNSCGLTLAQWTMGTGAGTAPPVVSSKAVDVAQALASTNARTSSISTTVGSPANSWLTRPYNVAIGTNYVDFAVTTTNYNAVTFNFDARGDTNGPTSLQIYYSVDGGSTFTAWGAAQAVNGAAFASYGGALPVAANNAGNTVFRISATGASNAGANANFFIDNVVVGGCQSPQPPTIAKAFSPGPIGVGPGSTSTLTFTVTNPNATPLTGVTFADAFPAGMAVASLPAASNSCGGTWAPSAGSTSVGLSGGTLAANSACTASVNVTLTTGGPHVNVSGFVSSTESGQNSGASGSAAAGLTGLLPPVLGKGFTPNPIRTNGLSALTFTIANPNLGNALTGVTLADGYPAGLVNAAAPAPTNSCGGALTATPGVGSMSLTGGSLAAGANCTIEIAVTAAAAGPYANTSGAVSATTAGNGNTASATLTVSAPAPAIGLAKKVGTSSTGPWVNFVVVAPTTPVYYQFVVENLGDVTLDPFSVADPQLAGTEADPARCDWQTTNVPSTLPALPAATATIDPVATCVRGPVPAVLGTMANTATAQGTFAGQTYSSDPAQATYLGASSSFNLSKQIAVTDAGPWSSNTTVAAGTAVYYQFTVSNTGALPLSGVTINDPLVPGATACALMNPLPVNAATTCVAGPVATDGVPGSTTTNTATASASDGTNTLTTPPSSASYTLPPASADVSLVKTLTTAGPYTVGQTISYSLVVANAGPSTATNVQVTDTPTNLSITSVSGGCTLLPCMIASIPTGSNITINVAATINAIGAFDNSATATADEPDPVPSSNTDNTGNNGTADPLADVSIVKTLVTPPPYFVGQTINYTLLVSNTGPSPAFSLTVNDVPTNLTITNVSSSVLCTAFPCRFGVMSAANSFTIDVTATINAVGDFDNSATVTASTADPNLSNNIDNTGNNGTADPSADVSIVKTLVTPFPYVVGQTVNYTLTVANAGPSTATNVLVTDAPSNLTITSVSGGGCAALPCTILSMPSGTSSIINVAATINAVGNFDNSAAATATQHDPNLSNNTDSTGNGGTADPLADVSIVKTLLTPGPHFFGQTINYRLLVSNAGPSPADIVTVSDTPSNLTITNVSSIVLCTTLPCTTAVLSAGNSFTIDVTATINAIGDFDNSATVTASTADPNLSNNTDDAGNGGTAAGSADVSVVKTNNATSVTAGSATTYLIIVANAGPSAVAGVQVVDNLPAAISGATWTVTGVGGAACPAAGGGSINTTVSLPAGSNCTFTLVAPISALATGTLINTATATVPSGVTDPVPGNNSSTDSDPITQPQADLSITKTDGVASVTQGGTTTYTIVVANAGQDAVANAQVVDTLPAGIASATWNCVGAGGATCPASGSGNINVSVNIPANGTVTFTVVAAISPTATSPLVNTATVTVPAGFVDPVPGNNSATDTNTVTPATDTADLQVTKSDGVADVTADSMMTYTVTVTNLGPQTVTGAVLHDPVSPGIAKNWVLCSPTPGVCVTPPLVAEIESGTFALPALASGQTYQVSIVAMVNAATVVGGSITNTATVTAPAGITDPVLGNNSASDTNTIVTTPTGQFTDLGLTKARLGPLVAGGTAIYEVVVTNFGPLAATGARVYDYATPGLSGMSWTCTVTASGAGPVITACGAASGSGLPDTTVTLNPNGTVRFLVTGTVSGAIGSNTSNTAFVAAPFGIVDSNAINNVMSSGATIDANADLAISKTDGRSTVLPGSQTSYTISIFNLGPHTANNPSWTDTLPTGTTFLSLSAASGWNCVTPAVGTAGAVSCSGPSMPNGASAGFVLTVAMGPGLPVGTLVDNTATVISGTLDPAMGNNTATDINSVVAAPVPVADLGVTKTNGTTQVGAGQPSTYTMVITNNGPDAAPNATLTDTLPVQMTFTSLTAPSGWNCTTPAVGATGTVSCSTPSMASTVTATFVVSVTVVTSTPGSSSISNTVTVSSGASDPVLSNNQTTDTDTVLAAPVAANLAIAKTNGGTQLAAGGTTTYTLTASNLGPDEVTGAVVTDLAPAGLTFNTWTCTVTNPGAGGSVTTACLTGSGVGNVSATVNLKAGAVVIFNVAATVAANASGSISNTATVNAPAGVTDPVLSNNSATDTDTIAAGPPPVVEVPTLSEWALTLLSLMLAGLAYGSMRAGRR